MSPARVSIILALLPGLVMLAGCDQLTGVAEQKALDAVAIGYACRVSEKKPEDCMKENESYSPDSILEGWKEADESLKGKSVEFGGTKHSTSSSADIADKPPESKPTETPTGPKDTKPATEQKPGDAKEVTH